MTTPERVNKLKVAMQGMATTAPREVTPAPKAPEAAPAGARPAASRRHKRNVSAYVAAEAAKQLRLLVAERDSSTQALVEEALNDLFRKYNKGAVA